ncbi:hypothetical protein N9A28_00135 [Sulfurimonas sp.]|nr:hypothetical protein [Sulfurimonas sp.]
MFLSLKENIDMVKDELNSEEKFFEKAVITEKFVKKYKNLMIAGVAGVVFLVTANLIYDASESTRITDANSALSSLMSDSLNKDALDKLKSSSQTLYDVWIYSQAVVNKDLESMKSIKDSKTTMVSDLASYELAKSSEELDEYALKQSAVYADLALVQSAIMLMSDNKIDDARGKLSSISSTSPLHKIANSLLHYGAK